jgi:DNA-binding PadR family transcriptional regulator
MSIPEPNPNARVTSTSCAILGMVGLRPCTTYELHRVMQRSFDYFWPRARSLVYAEVKRLAALGLVSAQKDFVGRRPRTTYAITPQGRAALAAWLRTRPQTFALEIEGLLRVYLAPFGTREDRLQTLEAVRDEAETMLRIAADFKRAYLEGTSPSMDQVHIRALLDDFLGNFAGFVREWAERSITTVSAWEDLGPGGKTRAALDTIARMPALEARRTSQRLRRSAARGTEPPQRAARPPMASHR